MALTAQQRGTIVAEAQEMRQQVVDMFAKQRTLVSKLGALPPAGPMAAPDNNVVRSASLLRAVAVLVMSKLLDECAVLNALRRDNSAPFLSECLVMSRQVLVNLERSFKYFMHECGGSAEA